MPEGKIYPPTQHHLQKLKDRGIVARSTTFIQAVAFAFASAALVVCSSHLTIYMKEALSTAIVQPQESTHTHEAIYQAIWTAGRVYGRVGLGVGLAAFVGCCVAALLHMKPGFTFQTATPSMDRINPFKRFKEHVLSLRAYRSTGLNLLCATCICLCVWAATNSPLQQLWESGLGDARSIAAISSILLLRTIAVTAGCLLVFGVIDIILQRGEFTKNSHMTYHERLEEARMQEQPPSLAQEIKRNAESLEGGLWRVRDATVLIRNPTHLVVGLTYNAKSDVLIGRAPRVICKGSGKYAEKLLERAALHGIPMRTNIPLARSLYSLPLDSEIPPELYAAVDALLSELAPGENNFFMSSSKVPAGAYTALEAILRQLASGADGPLRNILESVLRALHSRTR